MPAVSAVIICKNEEKNIGRCLQSLQGVADEIIVLDGFSTDRTPDICREMGVKFHQHEWMGYSETKNYANNLAAHPFILSMDADEALSDKLRANILSEKSSLKGAFSFNRLTNYCGQWIHHCGWYPDTKVRLFEKDKSRWSGTVHETLDINGQTLRHMDGDILHYSYYSLAEHESRAAYYASLAAERLKDRPAFSLKLKQWFSPIVRFIKSYLLKAGFLDGYYGWVISRMAAKEVYMKYKKALELKPGK